MADLESLFKKVTRGGAAERGEPAYRVEQLRDKERRAAADIENALMNADTNALIYAAQLWRSFRLQIREMEQDIKVGEMAQKELA